MAKRNEPERVMILGGTSAIATAVAHRLAANGHDLVLGALPMEAEALEANASDLRIKHGVDVDTFHVDALKPEEHAKALKKPLKDVGGVFLAIGMLGDQEKSQGNSGLLQAVLGVNFTGPASLLEVCAAHLEARGSGWICAISSVAGDRGRMSNYHMGAGKAGLSAYLSGLRNRMAHAGVKVTTIKPGFVDTPMTAGKGGMFLVASPDRVAKDIVKGIKRGKNQVYTPWFWRWVLVIIRSMPRPIFDRMRL